MRVFNCTITLSSEECEVIVYKRPIKAIDFKSAFLKIINDDYVLNLNEEGFKTEGVEIYDD